jgi:hypothetical protein
VGGAVYARRRKETFVALMRAKTSSPVFSFISSTERVDPDFITGIEENLPAHAPF